MSHVATVDVQITNLDDLETACKRIGLELVRDQVSYETHEGHRACDHAIRIPGDYEFPGVEVGGKTRYAGAGPHEIGVIRRQDGGIGYQLDWDHFLGGKGLSDFVGGPRFKNDGKMPKLKQAYAIAAARRVAIQKGFRVQEVVQATGGVKLLLTR